MLRKALLAKGPEVVNGFRLRGTEVSRIEAFADCVFGFGLTLLVVSLEVPNSYRELVATMRGFLAFGLCFAIFFGVWNRHYTYCRRFGLEDMTVRILTAVMLFVMLAYLYPLKFLTVLFVQGVLGWDVGAMALKQFDQFDIPSLFIVYGIGFAAIQIVFFALYFHAYRKRAQLELDELETLDTKWWTIEQAVFLLVPILSICIALTQHNRLIGWAGYVYFLLGIVGWIHGTMHGKRHRELVARLDAEAPVGQSNP